LHYGKNQDRKINCVAVHKKLPAEWLRLDSAKEFIEQNQAEIKTRKSGLFQTKAGRAGGTYAHWKVALAHAEFLFRKGITPGSVDPVYSQPY
jgi:hypothetical protein